MLTTCRFPSPTAPYRSIRDACNAELKADVAVLLMSEGTATLLLVGSNVTLVKAKVEVSIPRKRGAEAAGYDKAIERFFAQCLQAVHRGVDFGVVKCLVVAGPGFTREEFVKFLDRQAQAEGNRWLLDQRAKIVSTHASTAFKGSLKEVLSSAAVAARISDVKAVREVRALEEFFVMMARDPARAFYGPGHVFAAAETGAIECLLLSDGLLRASSIVKRRKYAELVEGVKGAGGEVHVFSAAHSSGEQLAQLTGLAAILRFPMPELEEIEIPPPPELL